MSATCPTGPLTPRPNTTRASSPRCSTAVSTPGLLDEVQWWQTDDLWYWSLEALTVYVRAAADRTGQSVESICRRLANDRGIRLAGNVSS